MGNACTKAGREEASFLKAVKDGDCRTVQAAIIHDVEWAYKVQTRNGQSVFHLAARYGRIDVLETVVEAVRFNPAGPEKWSKLLRMGHSTDALLRSFANLPDARSQSPLHLAAIYGHSEVAERLMQLGASPWCWDELGGRSPLHYAASMGHVDVIRVILSHHSPQPAGEALRRPNSTRTRLVDICNDAGYTPLHYAVWADNVPAVRALTSYEASLSARNVACGSDWVVSCLKCTPLHLAAHKGNIEVVKLLLSAYVQAQPHQSTEGQHTADRRRRDPRRHVNANRQLPYHLAVTHNHQQLVEVLHPDVPFSFILTAAEMETRLYGVAKLAVLASRALQAKLVADIDAAVIAMRTTAPATAIGTNGRTRSGSIAALSGAVLTVVAGQAGGPAAAHQVLAAAAARLRAAGERPAHSARSSMDLTTTAAGTAPDTVPPYTASCGASIVALRNVGRQGSIQSAVGSSLRIQSGVGSNRGSMDSSLAGAAAAAAAASAGPGAPAPAVAWCGGGGGGGVANAEGSWKAVQVAATAALGDGFVGGADGGVKAASNSDSAGSSAITSEDKEALPVEAVATPPQQDVNASRAPTSAAAPPFDAPSNNHPDALPLPPAPISPFLPTSTAGLASTVSLSSAVGATPRPPPTFNEAATAFALFAAEPFDEQLFTQPAAGGQGAGLQRSGSASITLAALARSRAQQQAMQQEMVSNLGGGGGGGGGVDGGRQLTSAGSSSVNLSVLAHSRVRGGGAGSGNNNTVTPSRSARLRKLLIGRYRASNTSAGNAAATPDQYSGNAGPDDLDDILYAMRPADDDIDSTTQSAATNAVPSTNAAVSAVEEGTPRAPPSPAPQARGQRAGGVTFWRRGAAENCGGGNNNGTAPGSSSNTSPQVISVLESTATTAAAATTPPVLSPLGPAPYTVTDPGLRSSGVTAQVNGVGNGADAGGIRLVTSATSLDGTAYSRLEPAGPISTTVVLPGVIETAPSLEVPAATRPRSPNAAADSASPSTTTSIAADPSFGDSSARRRNSISIAALARDVRVDTVGSEMAAANAACTAQPTDSAVMAVLASLVEAPQHVLRRYRLLQLTHGLDLEDLLREHSQRGDLGAGSGAGAGGSTGSAAAGVGGGCEVAAVAATGMPGTGPLLNTCMDGGAVIGLASAVTDWGVQSLVGMTGPPLPAAGGLAGGAGQGAVATWLAQDEGTEAAAAARTGIVPVAGSIPNTPRAGGYGVVSGVVGNGNVGCVGTEPLPPPPPPPASICSAVMGTPMDVPQAAGVSSGVSAFAALSGANAPAAAVGFPAVAVAAAAAAAAGTPGQLAGHLLRSLSSAAASEIGEGVCGVCFDLPDKLRIVGCSHRLCADCSRELCKMNGFKPALCPFCRGVIGGFKFAGK